MHTDTHTHIHTHRSLHQCHSWSTIKSDLSQQTHKNTLQHIALLSRHHSTNYAHCMFVLCPRILIAEERVPRETQTIEIVRLLRQAVVRYMVDILFDSNVLYTSCIVT